MSVQTDDKTKIGLYDLRLIIFYENYPFNNASVDFVIEIAEFCIPTQVFKTTSFAPNSLVYSIAVSPVVSTFEPLWIIEPQDCNIEYRLTIKSSPSAPVDPNLFTFLDE